MKRGVIARSFFGNGNVLTQHERKEMLIISKKIQQQQQKTKFHLSNFIPCARDF